jgi:hypothetical protein
VTSKPFLRDATFLGKYAVLLFHTGDIRISGSSDSKHRDSVVVDGWVPLRLPEAGAVLVKLLRQELDSVFRRRIEQVNYSPTGESISGDEPEQSAQSKGTSGFDRTAALTLDAVRRLIHLDS